MRPLDVPYGFDGQGRTATADDDGHLRDLIEAVLFTAPGERVNRPDFGCGLAALVFGPNSDELAAATQFLVQGALGQWLGDRIAVEDVAVRSEDGALHVAVAYARRDTGERSVAAFHREAP